MLRFRSFIPIVPALLFMILTSQFSHAAVSISVEQSGAVIGSNLDGVAGIDLSISYDISMLSTPTITKGPLVAKGMLVGNTPSPGTIKIAVISVPPLSGSGQIAAISFASNTGNGGIRSISASVIDSKGSQIPVQTFVGAAAATPATAADSILTLPINTPGIPYSSTPAASAAATTSKATTQQSSTEGSTVAAIQTDTLKTIPVKQVLDKTNPLPQESIPQHQPERLSTGSTTIDSGVKRLTEIRGEVPGQQVVFKSVADRFKTYRGDKSLPIMAALFSKEISKLISQGPTAALSDGKSGIRIVIDLPSQHANSPNFALDNATILSVKKESGESRRWIIEAMPEVSTWKATLSIIAGKDSFEYPLTVAPPLGSSVKTDQVGWELFLKESGSPRKQTCDFNNDGVCDYIDEFIFVANHLARK